MHLVPEATFAQHVAVVAREHDDGVVTQAAVVQGFDQFANVRVDVTACAEVGSARPLDGFGWHDLAPQVDDLEDAL